MKAALDGLREAEEENDGRTVENVADVCMNRDNRVYGAVSPNAEESAFNYFDLDLPGLQSFDFSYEEWNVEP